MIVLLFNFKYTVLSHWVELINDLINHDSDYSFNIRFMQIHSSVGKLSNFKSNNSG